MLQASCSVSYTHLDVYKRQGTQRADGKNTKWLCLGNYGCVYDINFVSTKNRIAKIAPIRANNCCFMARANGGVWYDYSNITKNNPYTVRLDSLNQLSLVLAVSYTHLDILQD